MTDLHTGKPQTPRATKTRDSTAPFPCAKGGELQNTPGNWQPALALVVLSPVVSDMLTGFTRLSAAPALVQQMGAWGCAALVIREITRRLGLGFAAVLWLGLAVALAEELLILQTSLAPMAGVSPRMAYGRATGVNWVWLAWALGFKTVWGVAIPAKLVELACAKDADKPWLSGGWLAVAGAVAITSFAYAWRSWVKVLVPKYFPKSVHPIQWQTAVVAVGLVALAIWVAMRCRRKAVEGSSEKPEVAPWQAGVAALLICLPWNGLFLLARGGARKVPYEAALLGAALLTTQAVWLGRRWFRQPNWSERHQFATLCGALLGGVLGAAMVIKVMGDSGSTADLIGKLGTDLFGIVALMHLHRGIKTQEKETDTLRGLREERG